MSMNCCVCYRCHGAHNVYGYFIATPTLYIRDMYGISVVVDRLAFIYPDLKKPPYTIEKSFYTFKWLSINRLMQGFRVRVIAGQS